jgi:hypothetical protein
MEQLADRYAELKGTKVIPGAYWIHENSITFVLESGPKLTMSTRELEDAIAKLEAQAVTLTAPPPADTPVLMTGETPVPPKKKGKKQ